MEGSLSLPSLLCEEDKFCLNLCCGTDENLCQRGIYESDDESIEKQIYKEANLLSDGSESGDCSIKIKMPPSWFKCARLDAVEWILKTRAFFGFHFQTAYLSLMYFDHFFSKRSIHDGKLWAIRLLSVACLSLAAKMEEYRAPAFSEYPTSEHNFKGYMVQRMELLVLETLGWKINLTTPFGYVRYFIIKFWCGSRPEGLSSRAIKLSLSIIKEINLVKYPPSMIAAAAVLAASENQLTRKLIEFKMNVISSWGFIQKDHIFSCYNLMQQIQMAKSSTPNPQSPLNLSLNQINSSDCLEKISITTSAVGTKRRLTYSESDQDCPLHKIHRS